MVFCSKIVRFILKTLLSQEETSCHKKKFHVTRRNFLSQEEISCHRKKLPVTGRNSLLQEETSCHRKKLPTTGRNFLSQKETSYVQKKILVFYSEIMRFFKNAISNNVLIDKLCGEQFILFPLLYIASFIICVQNHLNAKGQNTCKIRFFGGIVEYANHAVSGEFYVPKLG